MNDDDFDNDMELPDDDLTGDPPMSDPGDLGLGLEAEEDMEALVVLGRLSGGARARASSGPRPPKPAVPAARKIAKSPKKSAKRKAAGGGAKKKSARKSVRKAARKPARKAARKAVRKSARKAAPARRGTKKASRGRKKGGRRR